MFRARRLGILAALALLPALLVSSASAAGPEFDDSTIGRKAALLTGSALMSALYTPVKAGYFAVSTAAGAFKLVATLGQADESAARLWRRGVGGDWIVHPDVLTGHRELRFFGDPDPAP